MLYNVLNFYPLFYSFGPFLTLLDHFLLIYDVEDHFEHRFDHYFDPFVAILGIMSKLAYRLDVISVCILQDLMIVS